ncbi:hypothetical protein HNY73_003270 [Argiope bruennichi]|uniref:Uncharacterized protein n=1 Tax=Argiope bruennichi TaxID=94029 RepID=A0A8T0G0E4_ARGBR|nr:hypothetical protein HNY73_003270 [Argiope bruennichi]
MAYIDERSAYGVDTNIVYGHEVQYSFTVYGFIYTESLYFTRQYETMCRELPTLWEIGVRFQRTWSNKSILCHLSVKRIDNSPTVVRASSTVKFHNVQLQQLGRVISFQMMEITRGQEVQRTADPVLTPTEMASLFGQELKVRVSLKVTSCHQRKQNYDPLTSLSADMDKMFFPK